MVDFRNLSVVAVGIGAGVRLRCALQLVLIAFLVVACGRGEEPAEAPPRQEQPSAAPGTAVPTPEPQLAGALAVTFDDLPWVGGLAPGESRTQATRRLLAALADHGAPAVGFVDCGRARPDEPGLRMWLEAGHLLGNHTENHVDLDRAGAAAWLAAARRCDTFLRNLTGDTAIYFRYPYLHRGRTQALHSAAREGLEDMGAPVAPVTIVTLDWVLAVPYTNALRASDRSRAREIGEALVEHVARAAAHYREVAREKTGGDVAHILLLHHNALAADYLGAVLDRLRGDGFRFVTLETVLRDPVYDRPDDYIGPEGISWLYRMEPATPEMAAWDIAEERRLRAMFRR